MPPFVGERRRGHGGIAQADRKLTGQFFRDRKEWRSLKEDEPPGRVLVIGDRDPSQAIEAPMRSWHRNRTVVLSSHCWVRAFQ
jgi:hypothetical protein